MKYGLGIKRVNYERIPIQRIVGNNIATCPNKGYPINLRGSYSLRYDNGHACGQKKNEKIQSAEMRRSISKFVVYQIAIISGFLLETYMLENLLPVSKIVAGVIGMVEFKSILENVSTIVGQDILKMVLDKLGSKNAKGK